MIVYSSGIGFEMVPGITELQEQGLGNIAKKTENAARVRAADCGALIERHGAEGDKQAVTALHARYVDLVVASPETARDLVFAVGVPVLAVPDAAATDAPRHALVAWNGSREATRAVRDATDLLFAADMTTIVVFDPSKETSIGQDLSILLASHGLIAEIREKV